MAQEFGSLSRNDTANLDGMERRAYRRALLMLSGCLNYGDQKADCVVLDLSVNGAKVRIDGAVVNGKKFDLSLTQSLSIAASVDLPVEVVWQDDTVAGLRFLREPHDVARALEELLPEECLRFISR